MNYYRPCRYCGANLDPGEICPDCKNTAPAAVTDRRGDWKGKPAITSISQLIIERKKQYEINFDR